MHAMSTTRQNEVSKIQFHALIIEIQFFFSYPQLPASHQALIIEIDQFHSSIIISFIFIAHTLTTIYKYLNI
jgi:hypothetical protein